MRAARVDILLYCLGVLFLYCMFMFLVGCASPLSWGDPYMDGHCECDFSQWCAGLVGRQCHHAAECVRGSCVVGR